MNNFQTAVAASFFLNKTREHLENHADRIPGKRRLYAEHLCNCHEENMDKMKVKMKLYVHAFRRLKKLGKNLQLRLLKS